MIEEIVGKIRDVETNILVQESLDYGETKSDGGEFTLTWKELKTNEIRKMNTITHSMPYDWVFTIAPPYYQPSRTKEYMKSQLVETYSVCLKEALKFVNEDCPMRIRIAFPLLSTKFFRYPPAWSRDSLYTAYNALSKKEQNLLNVKLVDEDFLNDTTK